MCLLCGGPRRVPRAQLQIGAARLSLHDIRRVEEAKQLIAVNAEGLTIAHKHGCCNVVENLVGSLFWRFTGILKALGIIGAARVVCDYCAWLGWEVAAGPCAPWRKRTRFDGTLPRLSELGTLCGSSKKCRFTGKRHVVPQGRNAAGVALSAVAEPYLYGLCALVANLSAAAAAAVRP